MKKGKLIFFCAKMGAGKSTKALDLSKNKPNILLSEDEWLSALYPNKIQSLDDYIHYSNLLKPQIKKIVGSILASGVDVIMDFPANTKKQRAWFKSIIETHKVKHELYYLDVTDEVCLKQIENRRIEQPDRKNTDTPEIFEAVTRYFEAPLKEEGFNILSEK